MLVERDTKKSIAATIRYDATNKKAVLKPKRNLHSGTTYVLTLKGGASGVKDLAGNALAGNKVWTFTG
jgi:Bacterial Ig-like domain